MENIVVSIVLKDNGSSVLYHAATDEDLFDTPNARHSRYFYRFMFNDLSNIFYSLSVFSLLINRLTCYSSSLLSIVRQLFWALIYSSSRVFYDLNHLFHSWSSFSDVANNISFKLVSLVDYHVTFLSCPIVMYLPN